ncbi:MAG: 2-C-methyl-D-erythritol 4-phosphate cytidylyltransferase [Lachnospiraceae bacterium]|nr:2-C-methyl-D-erythritol 4-phosphate cytidylyltransferase [Lachnospiraceae bacterium]
MNTALLLSGGIGTRMGGEVPKQYVYANGKMVITYALEQLLTSQHIDCVWIVAERGWTQGIIDDAKKQGLDVDKIVDFILPGNCRQMSIWNGLQKIMEKNLSEKDTIIIHDAARPLISQQLIDDCYAALNGHDGVIPVLPMKDTIYFSEGGTKVESLLNRSALYAGQSPELFNLQKYYRANKMLVPNKICGINGSTEPAILAGMEIVMINGDEQNYKITTQQDFKRFVSEGNYK